MVFLPFFQIKQVDFFEINVDVFISFWSKIVR